MISWGIGTSTGPLTEQMTPRISTCAWNDQLRQHRTDGYYDACHYTDLFQYDAITFIRGKKLLALKTMETRRCLHLIHQNV